MLKIGAIGLTGILIALFLREVKPQFAVYISMVTCLLIFFYSVSKLSYIADTLVTMRNYVDIESSYLTTLLKIVGITYIADFSSNLCKDAGYGAIAGQIEIFGKLSVLAISTPILMALLETVQSFLK
ncbi:stage III sporulation protein AD [Murimonas intestini]|uniref:Stage III sporulation protein AD n=1 Tax=Murimonas intestini TaxID=1337051 RepID=A0AB73T739_9FIRM|nr:stage III sporulation protein AD [Murimonas intestini]MCR1841270.1 stage III sporulation protein AD [Murimonas intestini]MCR1866188.1 stage III sporulation protein AD [Murimonas intestini]MCR1882695.1 stage III sporulation protein AD [Murimonas intestini]